MAQRGPYTKGVLRREEILEKALDVIAREGMANTSLKQIAAAVEVTPAALLHYFGSKEHLLTEVLRRRDKRDFIDAESASPEELTEAFLALMRHNMQVPGLIEVFSRLSVDAADPLHPAHDYFLHRNAQFRSTLSRVLSRGDIGPALVDTDVDTIAHILQATSDGLQLQWLADRSVDIVAPMRFLLATLFPGPLSKHGLTPRRPHR